MVEEFPHLTLLCDCYMTVGVSSSCWKVPCHVGIFPRLAKASPDSILIIVSNHVDVLTYVAWKLSGFPVNRILGSCTNLKSSRFRFLIADHLDVNALEVQVIFSLELRKKTLIL
ncbi:L-lactate dehydrogenase A [Arabidopsis lyrata subsp. lyrata]|uniref:L-lactate dehydrogenase A n=1 Tax=Arabidopsis lyrata subsp. lyrata TaxID=81972 RepID=UPI000A29C681|nr:L-lactate dehydrogenase A [Arabidopsis lyrata subsp. lyrata]|eukprot:XP_020879693.1 L-lactate dehydrogenase A [Arabidopsis lyrata subsp. lyrata]